MSASNGSPVLSVVSRGFIPKCPNEMKQAPRLMVASQGFPPQVAGTPILLDSLLRGYPGEVMALAGYSHYLGEDSTFTPPCHTVYLRPPRVRLLERAYDRTIAHLHCLVRAFIRRHIKRWSPDVLLSAFPVVDFFIPAFQVAQEFNIPFYAHMHDLWQENCPDGDHRRAVAEHWEERILRGARRVLCMTEAQREHYIKKYDIFPELLPHSISPKNLARAPHSLVEPTMPRRTVLFVGNFSQQMNSDALAVLARASELLPSDVELLFCTKASTSELAKFGVRSTRLRMMWASREEVCRLQSAAHVLVAPLSFKNGSAGEVRTVFSTKLLEYLISGRPVLVFAPADSFHARSARHDSWAYVVDRDDPRALAGGIMRVMEDNCLARRLVKGALDEARRRDARIHAQRLYHWVREDSNNDRPFLL